MGYENLCVRQFYFIAYNGLQIGGRFNAANVLLGVWFYLKFERWKKLYS